MAVRSIACGLSLLPIPVDTHRVRLALCRVVWATTRSDAHMWKVANLPGRSRLCAQHVDSQVCQPLARTGCV
eukprot:12422085-Alexandrium_andersonii.AAC.1